MSRKINLLTPEEESFLDKLSYFISHYMRHFLVLSLFITNVIFLWRFQLDQQIVELKEEKEQKQEVIKYNIPLVNTAKEVATKLDAAQKILKKQDVFEGSMQAVIGSFPKDAYLTSFSLDEQTITLEGNSTSFSLIKSFQEELKKSPYLKNVALTNITRKEKTIEFTITASIANSSLVKAKNK